MPERFIGPYQRAIIEQLSCSPDEAAIVENLMRTQIFHSTLDWQTAAQLRHGAREAWTIFQADRDLFEKDFHEKRRLFEELKQRAGTA